jgi:hypothetical protein
MMSRGWGFANTKFSCLLEIIEEVLPIGPNDWDPVTEHHCSYYPGLGWKQDYLSSFHPCTTIRTHQKIPAVQPIWAMPSKSSNYQGGYGCFQLRRWM